MPETPSVRQTKQWVPSSSSSSSSLPSPCNQMQTSVVVFFPRRLGVRVCRVFPDWRQQRGRSQPSDTPLPVPQRVPRSLSCLLLAPPSWWENLRLKNWTAVQTAAGCSHALTSDSTAPPVKCYGVSEGPTQGEWPPAPMSRTSDLGLLTVRRQTSTTDVNDRQT